MIVKLFLLKKASSRISLQHSLFIFIIYTYLVLAMNKKYNVFFVLRHAQGNIHVLRKHKGGREGVSQMLTFAYKGGGGARGHTYIIIIGKKKQNNLHNLPNLNKNSTQSRNWKEFLFFSGRYKDWKICF